MNKWIPSTRQHQINLPLDRLFLLHLLIHLILKWILNIAFLCFNCVLSSLTFVLFSCLASFFYFYENSFCISELCLCYWIHLSLFHMQVFMMKTSTMHRERNVPSVPEFRLTMLRAAQHVFTHHIPSWIWFKPSAHQSSNKTRLRRMMDDILLWLIVEQKRTN